MSRDIVVVRKRSIPRHKRNDTIEVSAWGIKDKYTIVNVQDYGNNKTILKLRRHKRHRGR